MIPRPLLNTETHWVTTRSLAFGRATETLWGAGVFISMSTARKVESSVRCKHNSPSRDAGEVAERLNALVLKTSKG